MADLNQFHFILIDDNNIDTFITEKLIQVSTQPLSIKKYHFAKEALTDIQNRTDYSDQSKTILFVDIQMPVMNGFEFITEFEKLPAETQNHYIVWILTSSLNDLDINKAKTFKSIQEFIHKPLSKENLINRLSKLTN
jgi:CheY-like chemotaxis protein